jgi:hypothetical protein
MPVIRSVRHVQWWAACICAAVLGALFLYLVLRPASSTSATPSQSSPAGRMAAVDGSASASAYQGVMDCVVAAEPSLTDEEIELEMVGSWNVNGRRDSLWSYTKGTSILFNC